MHMKHLIWYENQSHFFKKILLNRFMKEHNIRKNMIVAMNEELADLNLTYSIGGQISFDVFPKGWDKTFCLNHIDNGEFDEIHFFGDKTFPGKNLFHLYRFVEIVDYVCNDVHNMSLYFCYKKP